MFEKHDYFYYCSNCEDKRSAKDSEKYEHFFICECGGTYRSQAPTGHVFQPYYNESHNQMVRSKSEEKAMLKKHGSMLMGDSDQLRKSAYIRKYKEDIIAERYAKEGLKYERGKNVRYNDQRHCFVPVN